MSQTNSIPEIPDRELEWSAIRASGPGGQHVNKNATAVQLRFSVPDSQALPEAVKERLYKKQKKRINKEGELIINANTYRSQHRNKKDALARLQTFIGEACAPPPVRRKTRPPRASNERRLRNKKYRASIKKQRGPVRD